MASNSNRNTTRQRTVWWPRSLSASKVANLIAFAAFIGTIWFQYYQMQVQREDGRQNDSIATVRFREEIGTIRKNITTDSSYYQEQLRALRRKDSLDVLQYLNLRRSDSIRDLQDIYQFKINTRPSFQFATLDPAFDKYDGWSIRNTGFGAGRIVKIELCLDGAEIADLTSLNILLVKLGIFQDTLQMNYIPNPVGYVIGPQDRFRFLWFNASTVQNATKLQEIYRKLQISCEYKSFLNETFTATMW